MLAEIWAQNLSVVFVGTTVTETSDQLGFYHLGPNNRFWSMLEYAGITRTPIVSPSDRKALVNAQKDGLLNDIYKTFFFEKREAALSRHHIGLTDLNRRKVYSNDDDPGSQPTPEDVQKFVKKVEKYRPKILAFVTSVEIFEKCLKPLYPSANPHRGKQDFLIGTSEVWLLGSTSGRAKDTEALEQIFEDLAERLSQLNKERAQDAGH